MQQFQEKATIKRIEILTDKNFRFTLYSPNIANHAQPGQFVMLHSSIGKDPLLRRPFSVHQATSNGCIQILFRVVGRGTDMLAHMKEGEDLDVLGPFGQGFKFDNDTHACMVAGGLGIAPIFFLAKRLRCRSNTSNDDIVIIGGRTKKDFEVLLEDFTQIGMHVMCATDDGSFGHHGLVTDLLKATHFMENTTIYSCGPQPMMAAVHQISLNKNVPCQVSVETVMACGMGACLGCTKEKEAGGYVHVCKEGPVFESKELKWNL